MTGEDLQWAERSLELATTRDPSLTGAWLRRSQLAEERGDQQEAWRRLVNGLALNPASAPLIDGIRRLWRNLDGSDRRDAERILRQYFGKQSAVWLKQIRQETRSPEKDYEKESISAEAIDVGEFALDRKIELPLLDFLPLRSNQQKLQDPGDQNDAAAGKAL